MEVRMEGRTAVRLEVEKDIERWDGGEDGDEDEGGDGI